MTTLRTSDGFSYTLTDRDRDYLVVSAKHEGEADPADIFWTYAQRLSLPQFRSWSLADLVKYHSQPVNPKWRRDGEFCRPGGRYHDQSNCREAVLATRDRNFQDVTDGWQSYQSKEPRVVQRLLDWEAGLIPNSVPRAVDFAAQNVAQGYVNRNPGSQIIYRKSNWFVAYPASLSWPDDQVTVAGGGGTGSTVGVMLLRGAALLVIGWVGWKFWRRK